MTQAKPPAVLTRAALLERAALLPRVPIAHLPTPLEEAPRLRAALGPDAPRIFIKRDDQTGLAFGGNKVRHLELRYGDILQRGADTLVLTNVAQSNLVRVHAALAAKFGLDAYFVKLRGGKDKPVAGNLLLDHMLGVNVVESLAETVAEAKDEVAALVQRLTGEGRVVYDVLGDRHSRALGTCAYALAAVEILEQLDAAGARADHIVLASGTSAAGLSLAGRLLGESYVVHPVSVGPSRSESEAYVCAMAGEAAALLGVYADLTPEMFRLHAEYAGPRHGAVTPEGIEAIRLMALNEGVILDPVYTGKVLAALIDQVRCDVFRRDETVVFVHTGGGPIVFAYVDEIMAGLE